MIVNTIKQNVVQVWDSEEVELGYMVVVTRPDNLGPYDYDIVIDGLKWSDAVDTANQIRKIFGIK